MKQKKILAIRDLIESAEKSIKNAKKLLIEVLKENNVDLNELFLDTSGLKSYEGGSFKVIEGVFTGDEMLGVDGNKYPVPSNYSSKSKLVQGDKLKLTIDQNGKMVYKQIGPIERETKIGLLVKENGKFQAIAEGKAYNLLSAAVTHFKAEIGDSLVIIVPAGREATFAAIEAVIHRSNTGE